MINPSTERSLKPLISLILLGAIAGIWIAQLAVTSSTPVTIPPVGDQVPAVTSTFFVFGVSIKESFGPLHQHSKHFSQFVSLVTMVFAVTGVLVGWGVYQVLPSSSASTTGERS